MGTIGTILRRRGPALWVGLGALLLVGLAAAWFLAGSRGTVQVGDVAIRPHAPVDPERAYRLVLWEENVVLSGAGTTYRSFLEERIKAFQEIYPNVTIDLELLPPGEAANRLEGALASGQPPDVYGSLAPRLFDRTYQIPVELFVPQRRGDEPLFLPSAWEALTAEDHVWGWPRWVRFITWAGRRSLLAGTGMDVDQAAHQGWTFPQALESLAQAGGGQLPGLLVHPQEPELFRSLMVAGGHGLMLQGGSLAWSPEAITEAAAFLLAARNRTHMPRNLETAARERVARFLHGTAGVITPVRPELAAHLLRTVPKEELVLLPPPRPEGNPFHVPADVAAYLVFRQSPYQGDDQTRLAMELARFLIQSKDAWVSAQFPAVPALVGDHPIWESEAPWTEGTSLALLQWAEVAVTPSIDPDEAAVTRQMDDHVLAPHLAALWDQEDPAAWALELHQALTDQVPEPGG